jgi:CheY-like chemotaxis protein
VLLADDHPVNRKVVEMILAQADVEHDLRRRRRTGCRRVRDGDYDLMLMDMQMPVMDGLTATREIRLHEAAMGLNRTPVVMLTANALAEHVASGRPPVRTGTWPSRSTRPSCWSWSSIPAPRRLGPNAPDPAPARLFVAVGGFVDDLRRHGREVHADRLGRQLGPEGLDHMLQTAEPRAPPPSEDGRGSAGPDRSR